MILTLLLNFLYGIVQGILSVLPGGSVIPTAISNAFTYVVYQISGWTFIFPIGTVLTILQLTIVIEFTLWTWHGGIWVYKRIRGS